MPIYGDDEQWENDIGLEVEFADPGGNSALRAASEFNPRIYPCPTCKAIEVLTLQDVRLGYQCDRCADLQERGGY